MYSLSHPHILKVIAGPNLLLRILPNSICYKEISQYTVYNIIFVGVNNFTTIQKHVIVISNI